MGRRIWECSVVPITTNTERVSNPSNNRHKKTALQTKGLLGCSILAWIVFFIYLGWTIWAGTNRPVNDDDKIGTLYTGSCSDAHRLNLWLHLGINILSTLLLGASNYCMQVALAPTREEVDRAHQSFRVLSIGTPSLRNLGRISWRRGLICAILAGSVIPLHLLVNSSIFPTVSVTEYSFAIADETFFVDPLSWDNRYGFSFPLSSYSGEPFYGDNILRDWDNLTVSECISTYGTDFMTAHRNVLVVVDPVDVQLDQHEAEWGPPHPTEPIENKALQGGYRQFHTGVNAFTAAKHYDWLCLGTYVNTDILEELTGIVPGLRELTGTSDATEVIICDPSLLLQNSTWHIDDDGYLYKVRYCMSEPQEESCKLEYSATILGIVCATNFIKAMTMTLLVFIHRRPSLLTIGDAIASFIQNPDPTTLERCTWSARDFRRTSGGAKRVWSQPTQAQKFVSSRHTYGSVPSRARWNLTLAPIVAALVMVVCLLTIGLKSDNLEAPIGITDLWARGIGGINTISIIGKGRGGSQSWQKHVLSMVVLANTPQVLLSVVYYAYNGLFTTMCAGAEWASLGARNNQHPTNETTDRQYQRKTLRVSRPVGKQRGRLYLQLPYQFSIPLLILSALIHWLTSQSLFLVRITGTDSHGKGMYNFLTTCGYSCIAMILALIVGTVAVFFVLGTAVLPLRSNMPVVGSSSAAISASCHVLAKNKKVDVENDTFAWGVELPENGGDGEESEGGIGHLCVTSGRVERPVDGKLYM